MRTYQIGIEKATYQRIGSSMKKWEYMRAIVSSDINGPIPEDEAKEFLNLQGYIGWELVTIVDSLDGYAAMWFKRELKK